MNLKESSGSKIPTNIINEILEISCRINNEPMWIMNIKKNNKLSYKLNMYNETSKKINENIEKKINSRKNIKVPKYEIFYSNIGEQIFYNIILVSTLVYGLN